MFRKEINERSPMRIFEQSIHGGLGRGNVGLVLSHPGLGKTPFLVGIALDDLMRERKVLHMDTKHSAPHVREYYEEIFRDLAITNKLEDRSTVHLMMEQNRVINSFCHGSFEMQKFERGIGYMMDHMQFKPDLIIMDGYPDLKKTNPDELAAIKALGTRIDAEVWLSGLMDVEAPGNELPGHVAELSAHLDVVVAMNPTADHVRLQILKDHDNADLSDLHIELDPKTLLLINES